MGKVWTVCLFAIYAPPWHAVLLHGTLYSCTASGKSLVIEELQEFLAAHLKQDLRAALVNLGPACFRGGAREVHVYWGVHHTTLDSESVLGAAGCTESSDV